MCDDNDVTAGTVTSGTLSADGGHLAQLAAMASNGKLSVNELLIETGDGTTIAITADGGRVEVSTRE